MLTQATPTYAKERLSIDIYDNELEGSHFVAREIANLIESRNAINEPAVLGLATGASPMAVYDELIHIHREEGLSFKNVITFNLDEYFPIEKQSLLSYNYFMRHHLFDHLDIPEANIHIPNGELSIDEIKSFCDGYEELIESYGGLDIQLLGIGRTGHIGFNEPPSFADSRTRLVKLDFVTIADATREFLREDAVPKRAITMGISTIMKAKKIFLLAWGEKKANVVRELVEGSINENFPASFLQRHPATQVLVDPAAAASLTRIKAPWLVSLCLWDEKLTNRAVLWLAQKLNKPLLKLTEEDYKQNELGDLLVHYGNEQDLNVHVFTRLQRTITGWPGGKPNADDKNRPERAVPAHKRILIFSPHPDDDVISMGGTFRRLVDQGHEVHVAYQTSGNLAVHDDDALRYTEFFVDFMQTIYHLETDPLDRRVAEFLQHKKLGDRDNTMVRSIKGLIRKEEAKAAARHCGLEDHYIHFMDLPFYESGSSSKLPIAPEDLNKTRALLSQIQPHQIFAAGDLYDPHGTHKICLDIILESMKSLKTNNLQWQENCYLWLYKGAWHEWELSEIDMAVPLSPADLMMKRRAIFKHQSQKDSPVFPGNDKREFWQRAEQRNKNTAQLYDQMGLTEYEAIEAFVRYHY